MKILFVTGKLESPLVEGTQKSVVNLANELVSSGHTVTWLSRTGGDRPDELSEDVEVVRKDYKLSNVLKFKALADRFDVVNVHTSSVKMAGFWNFLAYRNSLITWAARRSRGRLGFMIQRLCSNTAVTETVGDWLPGSPEITRYGVDTQEYDYSGDEGEFEISFIGKPSKGRGFDHLCKVLTDLDIDFRFKYGLAKSRGNLEEAEDKLEEYGIKDSTDLYYGFIEDLPEFLGSSDIFVNLIENTYGITSPPILTVEAMSCRTVTISSTEPDFQEIVEDGKEGFLANYDDYEKITEIIEEISKDRTKMSNIGDNAREKVVEKHSIDRSVNEFLQAYRTFLEK